MPSTRVKHMAATTMLSNGPAASPAANGGRKTPKKSKRRGEESDAAAATPPLAKAAQQMRAAQADADIRDSPPHEADDDEQPLGERAAALHRVNGAAAAASDEDAVTDDEDADHTAGATGRAAQTEDLTASAGVSGRRSAESVVMLLKQALRGEDMVLLQKCLAVDDERVVKTTVRQLGPEEVAALLRLLTARLQTVQPGNKSALGWLQHTLLLHAGYIASAPGLQAVLAGMYETIDARLATLPSMLALSGRLNLLLAQVPPPGEPGAGAAELLQPQVYMDETDSDDEGGLAVEDPYAPDLQDAEDDDDDSLLSEDDDMMDEDDDE